jgi:2-keto-3-deoxy-L-rhamnonate aldolase RhmA
MIFRGREMGIEDGASAGLAGRIRRREPLLGTVVSVPDAALAELLCERFDFVWIDLEHGQLGPREAQVMAIAARAAGCAALVRLPRPGSELIPALLDAGVDGVVAPRVEDAATAELLVEQLRYPPSGSRGVAPRRASSYGRVPDPWRVGGGPACVVQIESAAAVGNAAAIAAVDGVDALVVGCSDLSLDLGVPGELDSPPVLEAVRRVERSAADASVACGVAAPRATPALAALVARGSTIFVYSSDVRIYATAVDDAVADLSRTLAEHESHGCRST